MIPVFFPHGCDSMCSMSRPRCRSVNHTSASYAAFEVAVGPCGPSRKSGAFGCGMYCAWGSKKCTQQKKRLSVRSGSDRSLIDASASLSLVIDVSVSPCPCHGRALRSHVWIPCDRPLHGLKYQCDAAPMVAKPALLKRSATKVFDGAYTL